jgi:hypothetical protein
MFYLIPGCRITRSDSFVQGEFGIITSWLQRQAAEIAKFMYIDSVLAGGSEVQTPVVAEFSTWDLFLEDNSGRKWP